MESNNNKNKFVKLISDDKGHISSMRVAVLGIILVGLLCMLVIPYHVIYNTHKLEDINWAELFAYFAGISSAITVALWHKKEQKKVENFNK